MLLPQILDRVHTPLGNVSRIAQSRRWRFLKHLVSAIALSTSMASVVSAQYVDAYNGTVVDQFFNPWAMRGANVPHAFFPNQTAAALASLAARHANCARIVLGCGVRFGRNLQADVSNVIQMCKNNNLIAVLEVQDTTGFGEQVGAATLDQAVDYWISIAGALQGQEAYAIVNIGNEPLANNQPASAWIDGHKNAITRLRNAGIYNTLMVDGANYGQDWSGVMRQNASDVFYSDPFLRVIFSVHMYESYRTAAAITTYLDAFAAAHLPLVIGEFGPANGTNGGADLVDVMALAQQRGIGYLGWSWSGNDLTNQADDITIGFNNGALSTWGNTLFNDPNGVTATSVLAGFYRTIGFDTSPVVVGPDGGMAYLAITSNDGFNTSADPWISVQSHGPAGNSFLLPVWIAPDPTGAGRTGYLGFTGFTPDIPSIPVIQIAAALNFFPGEIQFSGIGTTRVAVNGNINWRVIGSSPWLRVTKSLSPPGVQIDFVSPVPAGMTERDGTVTIATSNATGSIVRTLTVRQFP